MKKKVKSVFTIILVIFVCLACFSFVMGFIRKDTDKSQVSTANKKNHGEYTFEIVEKSDSFYYPTLSGYVAVVNRPTRLTVDCNDVESEVEIKTLKRQNGYWVVSFNEEIIYGALTEGEHPVIVNVYYGNKSEPIGSTTLVVDELYTAINGWDIVGEKSINAMDKESCWIGPY